MAVEFDEDDESICANGYPEHREEVMFEDDKVIHWMCRRCGAEVFEEKQ